MCLVILRGNMCRVDNFPMTQELAVKVHGDVVKQQVPGKKEPGQRKRHEIMEMNAWENIFCKFRFEVIA